jgi:putative ABC transport system substrate-binding protein
MRRRDFILLVGGAAARPIAAHAQQADRMRRVGILSGLAADGSDQLGQTNVATFSQALQQLGWIDGRNVRIDHRSIGGLADLQPVKNLLTGSAHRLASQQQGVAYGCVDS